MSPADPPASAPAGDDLVGTQHRLPVGTAIGGLEIIGLIGEGGFGIVYLAFDTTLQRQVALKEYMPAALAARARDSDAVTVRSAQLLDTFNAGLRSFINEARLLARFDHPALVKVHQFWQANRTAYMVMPYYQGPTLKAQVKALAAQGRAPGEAELRRWLAPLLDALEVMHAEQCYHRDVAPDNIILTAGGPLLLDFGAARRVISDMTHALTVILKPGYAPIEQYGEAASMTQGPWTDLYALAGVVYFAITGRSPITSVERVMGDPLPRLAEVAAGRYGERFLQAIDRALSVRPAERPQSVAEFRALLGAGPDGPPTTAEAGFETTVMVPARRVGASAAPETLQAGGPPTFAPTVVRPHTGAASGPTSGPTSGAPGADRPPAGPPAAAGEAVAGTAAAPRRRGAVVAAGAVLIVGAVAAAWTWRAGAPAGPTPDAALRHGPPAAAVPAATPTTPATSTTSTTSTTPATSATSATPAAPAPAAAPPAAAPPAAAPPAAAAPTAAAPTAVTPAAATLVPATPTAAAPAAARTDAAPPAHAVAPAPPRLAKTAPPARQAAPAAGGVRAASSPSARTAAAPSSRQALSAANTAGAAIVAPTAPARRAASTAAAAAPSAYPPAAGADKPARPEAATASRPPRCAELLAKGAQQPLTVDEAGFLRRECR